MEYLSDIISSFRKHADPTNALFMKKYMKNNFEFLGLKTPVRKALSKPFMQKETLPDPEKLPDLVHALWGLDEREFQYFAIQLLMKFNRQAPEQWIDLYEFCIVNKSWWDTVDGLAGWCTGSHFIRFPNLIAGYTNRWMDSGNMWLQRSCLLYQLKYKEGTNFELLKSFILPLKDSGEFFIQKAIGWALREYSKTNPEAVEAFVGTTELKSLSRREAMRIILKKG
jgi:3-methyladenine DNA glycosylase AlkD